MTENEISREVVDAALSVHRTLGPGLLESVYEAALAYELDGRGLGVERQALHDHLGSHNEVGAEEDSSSTST